MARKKGSRKGGRRSGGMGSMFKAAVNGFLGGTLGTAVSGNKLGGAAAGAGTQYLQGTKDTKSLAIAAATGYFAHDAAVWLKNAFGGATGFSGAGPYG